jgi:hypothetical protein
MTVPKDRRRPELGLVDTTPELTKRFGVLIDDMSPPDSKDSPIEVELYICEITTEGMTTSSVIWPPRLRTTTETFRAVNANPNLGGTAGELFELDLIKGIWFFPDRGPTIASFRVHATADDPCADLFGYLARRERGACLELVDAESTIVYNADPCGSAIDITTFPRVLCGWDADAGKWMVLRVIPIGCSPLCGWNPINAKIDSVTRVSGSMTITRVAPSGSTETQVTTSGTGESIALMTAHFTDPLRVTLQVTFPHVLVDDLPTSGSFWFGVRGGKGVKYNFGTGRVYEVDLHADGTILSTGNSAEYDKHQFDQNTTDWTGVTAWGPDLFVTWCHIGCDRVYIGGLNHVYNEGSPVAGPPYPETFATAHAISAILSGDRGLAFGSNVDATTPIVWSMNAICRSTCPPCNLFSDWPTPGKAGINWAGALSKINTGDRGDPKYGHLSNPVGMTGFGGVLSAFREDDGVGVSYVLKCGWSGGGGDAVTVVPGSTISDIPGFYPGESAESFGVSLFPGTESPHPVGGWSGSYESIYQGDTDRILSAFDETKWHAVIQYGFSQWETGGVFIYSNVAGAVYEGEMLADRSIHTFTLKRVFHVASRHDAPVVFIGDPDNPPFIDPESWPGSVSFYWQPYASECPGGPPPPCTGECQWVGVDVGGSGSPYLVWTSVNNTCSDCGSNACANPLWWYGFEPSDTTTIVTTPCLTDSGIGG